MRDSAEHRAGHRHARDERLHPGLGGDRAAVGDVERRRVREERSRVAVGADAHHGEVERDALERAVVVVRGELGASSVWTRWTCGRAGEAVEQRLAHQAVVREAVRRRDAALVDPPEIDAAPVGAETAARS